MAVIAEHRLVRLELCRGFFARLGRKTPRDDAVLGGDRGDDVLGDQLLSRDQAVGGCRVGVGVGPDLSAVLGVGQLHADLDGVEFSVYQESPELLEVIDNPVEDRVVRYHSALLKSNCRVTSQPDWGDVYIEFKGKKAVDPISLLKYIVSFRDECHFHEEICEALTKRLLDALDPEELTVRCLYARRGGIDINPERYIAGSWEHDTLNDVTRPYIKTPKQ